MINRKKNILHFQDLTNWFDQVTKGRFLRYKSVWNQYLFLIINLGAWATTIHLNGEREMDLNDIYFLFSLILFTYETILKQKR